MTEPITNTSEQLISDEQLTDLIERMNSVYSAKVLYGMYPIIPVEAYLSALRELQQLRQGPTVAYVEQQRDQAYARIVYLDNELLDAVRKLDEMRFQRDAYREVTRNYMDAEGTSDDPCDCVDCSSVRELLNRTTEEWHRLYEESRKAEK